MGDITQGKRSFGGLMALSFRCCAKGKRFKSRRCLSYSEICFSDFHKDFHRLGLKMETGTLEEEAKAFRESPSLGGNTDSTTTIYIPALAYFLTFWPSQAWQTSLGWKMLYAYNFG